VLLQDPYGIGEQRTDALLQFAGGGFREGYNRDFTNAQARLFAEETEVQAGYGVGFPGACGCFDHAHPVQIRLKNVKVFRSLHRASSILTRNGSNSLASVAPKVLRISPVPPSRMANLTNS